MKKLREGIVAVSSHPRRWTQEEVDFLKDNYKTLSQRDMAKRLNRTEKSINRKTFSLNLKKRNNFIFSKEEIDFLIKNYRTISSKEIVKKINKPLKVIQNKAFKLGLPKKNLSKEEWNRLIEDYKSKIYCSELSKKYGVSKVAIYNHLKSEGIKKNKFYEDSSLKKIWIDKISKTKKLGYLNGNYNPSPTCFKKGIISHNKGKTKETYEPLKKVSINLSKNNKGKHFSPKTEFKKGENHPMFNNWSSLEPYDKNFNKEFKKAIKERDGCCLMCNVGFEDLKLLKRQICIHHINYDKILTIKENCCALCNKCHSMTQTDRKSWTKFFQFLLSERYGYKYAENGDIILEVKNEQ